MTFISAHLGHWYHALIYLVPVLIVLGLMYLGDRRR